MTVKRKLLSEALAPFSVQRRNNALEMARLYAVINCFENELRDFIRETLQENIGDDWFKQLPQKIQQHAESRKKTALKDSWLEGEKTDLLGFLEFGHLAQIVIDKWEHFQVIPSQHWLKQRMDEMEKVRKLYCSQSNATP